MSTQEEYSIPFLFVLENFSERWIFLIKSSCEMSSSVWESCLFQREGGMTLLHAMSTGVKTTFCSRRGDITVTGRQDKSNLVMRKIFIGMLSDSLLWNNTQMTRNVHVFSIHLSNTAIQKEVKIYVHRKDGMYKDEVLIICNKPDVLYLDYK